MSAEDEEFKGFAIPIPPEVMGAIKASIDYKAMHREDFSNRLDDMLKNAPAEHIETILQILSMITGNAKKAAIVGSYFEGMMTTSLLFREKEEAKVPLAPSANIPPPHDFVENKDLGNLYCQVCQLPPANRVHN